MYPRCLSKNVIKVLIMTEVINFTIHSDGIKPLFQSYMASWLMFPRVRTFHFWDLRLIIPILNPRNDI